MDNYSRLTGPALSASASAHIRVQYRRQMMHAIIITEPHPDIIEGWCGKCGVKVDVFQAYCEKCDTTFSYLVVLFDTAGYSEPGIQAKLADLAAATERYKLTVGREFIGIGAAAFYPRETAYRLTEPWDQFPAYELSAP
jgi:hypothetical protein